MKKTIFLFIALAATLILVIMSCNKTIYVTGVKLDNTTLTLGIGETTTLTVTVFPEKATDKTVVFTSSNTIVATVMPNGLVTALSKGETTIIVSTVDGNFYASCQVKVEEISVSEVKLNKSTLTLDIDETETLIATVLPENATNKIVSWTISNPAVATVVNGMVYPLSLGDAIITVTTLDGNKTAKCNLEVIKKVPVTGITLDKTALNLGVGDVGQLTETVWPENATNKNVAWSSSNSAIASVDDNGLVTTKDEGTAIITVTTEEGNFTATCEVKCINATPPVLTTLTPSNVIIDGDGYPSAILGGNVTDVGNPAFIERGIIYMISPEDPMDPSGNWNPFGFEPIEVVIPGNGIGTFSQRIDFPLHYIMCDSYNVRAYVKTIMGTTYGNMVKVSADK